MSLLFLIIALSFVGLLGIAALVMFISVFVGVPFVPTHRKQAHTMITLAGIRSGTKVIDLGSGAGRLLFLAAAHGAQAVGYELNPLLYIWTKIMIVLKGLSGRVEVRFQSLYHADVRQADVVVAFLFPKPMERLGPKLFAELPPGARIVSYAFPIPGHEPVLKQEGIFVYEV